MGSASPTSIPANNSEHTVQPPSCYGSMNLHVPFSELNFPVYPTFAKYNVLKYCIQNDHMHICVTKRTAAVFIIFD